MRFFFHLLALIFVLGATDVALAQDRKCSAIEAEISSIQAEDNRLRAAFKASIGRPEIPKEVCKNLNDQIKFNARVANIFRKCVDEGFPGFADKATQYEQENRQVYMKTAAQYECQRYPD